MYDINICWFLSRTDERKSIKFCRTHFFDKFCKCWRRLTYLIHPYCTSRRNFDNVISYVRNFPKHCQMFCFNKIPNWIKIRPKKEQKIGKVSKFCPSNNFIKYFVCWKFFSVVNFAIFSL